MQQQKKLHKIKKHLHCKDLASEELLTGDWMRKFIILFFVFISVNCNFLCRGRLIHYPILLYLKPGRTVTDLEIPFSKILIQRYIGIYTKLSNNDFEYAHFIFRNRFNNSAEIIDITEPVYVIWLETKKTKHNAEKIKENLKKDGYVLIKSKNEKNEFFETELNFYKIGNYNALLGVSRESVVLLLQLDCRGKMDYLEWLYFEENGDEYSSPKGIFQFSYYIE